MDSNFFKSYFKANGIVSTLLFAGLLILAGCLAAGVNNNFATLLSTSETANEIVIGLIGGVLIFGACAGLTGLKNEKATHLDMMRIAGFVASIGLVVFYIINFMLPNTTARPGNLAYIGKCFTFVFIGTSVVFLIESVLRFIFVKEDAESCNSKNYFGSFARKYNPILILVISACLAAGLLVFVKYGGDAATQFCAFFESNVLLVVGLAVAFVFVLIAVIADKANEASLMDLILSVLLITSACVAVALPFASSVSAKVSNYMVVIFALATLLITIRAVNYTNGEGYTNPSEKIRTYFKGAYGKYNMILPIVIVAAVVALASLISAALAGTKNITASLVANLFPELYANAMFADILVYVYAGVLALLFIFTLIYNKFTNANTVRTDKVLPMLFVSSIVGVFAYLASLLFGTLDASHAIASYVLVGASGAFLVYAIIILIIRLKSFDPIQELIAKSQAMSAMAKAEEKKEQEVEETAEEEAAEEAEEEAQDSNDPFALTDDDEALFNQYYGSKATTPKEEPVVEETPVEEEVVEEVVEEEPAEEIVEEVVEEVVEETPVETTEYANTEAAPEAEEADEEEEAEDDDDDADDADEAEEADEEEAPVEEVHSKERDVILPEFEVLDENGEPKKIKRRFMAKMMYAEPETKDYYNEIRNYLEMYRAKGRQSSRCETFRYKGLVAKVALGGKAVKVFLALDTSFVEENPKYHLKDVSEKKQYKDVPVLIKVRSDRGLKYFKELVDIMMANRGVKPKRNFEPTNYLPQLIPNGEAILGAMGMSSDYMQNTMNVRGIPTEMPDNLEEFIPQIPAEPLEDEEVEANVYLDTLCTHFDDNAEITIDVLKSYHIVNKGNVLRIKARGTLDRKLIIYAEYFDEDALKMILCTNGTAIKVVR